MIGVNAEIVHPVEGGDNKVTLLRAKRLQNELIIRISLRYKLSLQIRTRIPIAEDIQRSILDVFKSYSSI